MDHVAHKQTMHPARLKVGVQNISQSYFTRKQQLMMMGTLCTAGGTMES